MYVASHSDAKAARLGDAQDPQTIRDLLELLSSSVLDSDLYQSAMDQGPMQQSL